MSLPHFLCIGAAKAGTTSLHDILIQHPDIFMPSIKEAHFFDYPKYYNKGMDWYENKVFGGHKNEKIAGEITPSYLYLDYVPERIYKALGNKTKLLIMLRNPVERAYSQYLMNVRRGFEEYPFEKAVQLEGDRINGDLFSKILYSYFDRGLYSVQIQRYLKYFSQDNIFFIIFEEDFLTNREETIHNVLHFLGVDKAPLELDVKSNPASIPRNRFIRDLIYKDSIVKKIGGFLIRDSFIRKKFKGKIDKLNRIPHKSEKLNLETIDFFLKKYFYSDILELEKILGRKLNIWFKNKDNSDLNPGDSQ